MATITLSSEAVFVIGSCLGLAWLRIKRIQGPLLRKIRIGTRKSSLAMVQTRHIASLLKSRFPYLEIEIIDPMDTIGDKILGEHLKALSQMTPGLFTKGLESGLIAGRFDCVVHSLKDMPTRLPAGMVLAAITARANPNDVVVIRSDHVKNGISLLEDLPDGSVIGTSSIRREAILKHRLKDKSFKFKLIRGNVNRRLEKLETTMEYDATILAAAGLHRLGSEFQKKITSYLEPPKYLYGVSQGALGLECSKDNLQLIRHLRIACSEYSSSIRCLAERSLLRTLEGGCQLPLGVASSFCNETQMLHLQGIILDENGESFVERTLAHKIVDYSSAEDAGTKLAFLLLQNGGRSVLSKLRNYTDEEGRDISRPLTYGSAENPNVSSRPS